jgi:hypothetical protein
VSYFGNCTFCGATTTRHENYCSWKCHVEHARAQGAVEVLPNGLPPRCITADGKLLECEDGDHPTYICPVVIEPTVAREDEEDHPQTHALIYTDGTIAVTMYECCYAMVFCKTRKVVGSLWPEGRWRLSDKASSEIWDRWVATQAGGDPHA